jgi:hypothetical protein
MQFKSADFDKPVSGEWVLRYMEHFMGMAMDPNRTDSEREHFEANMRICRDLIAARELLTEAARSMDYDPIACSCAKADGGGNQVVADYAGNCIFCRIRTATGVPVPGTPEHREYIEKRIAEE